MFIRHADKEYDNGKGVPAYDPGLTPAGIKKSQQHFLNMVNQYGLPSKIISSPYLRTRQTANIAQEVIYKHTGTYVHIEIDPLLSEYLGHQKHHDIKCFHAETYKHGPIGIETKETFKLRLETFVDTIKPGVWYISHGYTIYGIFNVFGKPCAYPAMLEVVRLI